ncbi:MULTISPECIES: hypothetical protein [unclassified Sulfitobacter]|uniref:hypothetical protein n=1 Tax=unclassified Sulfitobacter TaxID=196795 RepID=UPI00374605C7
MGAAFREILDELYSDIFWDGHVARTVVRKKTRWGLTWHPQREEDIILLKEFGCPKQAIEWMENEGLKGVYYEPAKPESGSYAVVLRCRRRPPESARKRKGFEVTVAQHFEGAAPPRPSQSLALGYEKRDVHLELFKAFFEDSTFRQEFDDLRSRFRITDIQEDKEGWW